MYALSDNQQALKSRRQIRDALLSLMRDTSFQEITVSEICRQAKVVRQTYYRHFDTKNDVLDFHMDELFAQYFVIHFFGDTMLAQLEAFYAYMLENEAFLRMVSRDQLFFMVERTIIANLAAFLDIRTIADVEDAWAERYVTGFIAATICSLLSQWTQGGFQEPVDRMARLTQRLLRGLQAEALADRE